MNTLKFTRIFYVLLSIFLLQDGFSQSTGIGTSAPNPNAVLDISSATKGLLMPRMDSVSRKNMVNVKGMIVYDTSTSCLWYNTGSAWSNISPKANTTGAILYWNGLEWTPVAAGTAGQLLSLSNTLTPVWVAGSAAPALTTTAVTGISTTTAISGGTILSDGGVPVTARGVVWSTVPNPTIALATKTNDGSGSGTFSSSITGLSANTTYYVRAYASNANGTAYGNETSFASGASFTLGQAYGGGIIFYIDGTGQHGLIAATADATTDIYWSNSLTNTAATGLAIGTGAANTNTIVGLLGNGIYAASFCKNYYHEGGFNDWYLPSLMELNMLFIRRNLVPGLGINEVPFIANYWSSSENSVNDAWTINFSSVSPNQTLFSKNGTIGSYGPNIVRAIRSF